MTNQNDHPQAQSGVDRWMRPLRGDGLDPMNKARGAAQADPYAGKYPPNEPDGGGLLRPGYPTPQAYAVLVPEEQPRNAAGVQEVRSAPVVPPVPSVQQAPAAAAVRPDATRLQRRAAYPAVQAQPATQAQPQAPDADEAAAPRKRRSRYVERDLPEVTAAQGAAGAQPVTPAYPTPQARSAVIPPDVADSPQPYFKDDAPSHGSYEWKPTDSAPAPQTVAQPRRRMAAPPAGAAPYPQGAPMQPQAPVGNAPQNGYPVMGQPPQGAPMQPQAPVGNAPQNGYPVMGQPPQGAPRSRRTVSAAPVTEVSVERQPIVAVTPMQPQPSAPAAGAQGMSAPHAAYLTPAFASKQGAMAQEDEEADAVPSDKMAMPAPVPLSVLGEEPPRKRLGWLWGTLVALALLAAAALALWQTGILSQWLGRELPEVSQVLPAFFDAAPGSDAVTAAIDPSTPMADSVTAIPATGTAPAVVKIRVHTNESVIDIRLMDENSTMLTVADMHSAVDSMGKLWEFDVRFNAVYSGDIRVYLCGADSVWMLAGMGCTVDIR